MGFLLLLIGCGRSNPSDSPAVQILGGPGSEEGRFATPRASAWDPRGFLYVVDKSARIQKFDAAGKFLRGWSTPARDKGRPTGLAVEPGGTLLVADTHYHRILRYSPDGDLLHQFGSEGTGPGQFIYPVGLAVAKDGTLYVSEFGGNDVSDTGGNDRVQVFTPEGKLLRSWGTYGDQPGQFKRPQGIAVAPDRLYVADAVNHRVQVFTLDGKLLGVWADLKYPYSVSIDPAGDVLVAEYGRHCVTKFTPDGTRVASAGKPGGKPGELHNPWAAVSLGDRIAVVDADNHRVQLWPASFLAGGKP